MTGSDYERKLARKLDQAGYHVMRAPSSGSATERDLPDLMWSKPQGTLYVAEMKTTGENTAYYKEPEVTALRRFARAFNGTPTLVARFKGDTTFYGIWPDHARRTDANNYAVDQEMEETWAIV